MNNYVHGSGHGSDYDHGSGHGCGHQLNCGKLRGRDGNGHGGSGHVNVLGGSGHVNVLDESGHVILKIYVEIKISYMCIGRLNTYPRHDEIRKFLLS